MNAEDQPDPRALWEQIMDCAEGLREAWSWPKDGKTVALIEDLGLKFQLLTSAFDASRDGSEVRS